MGDNHTSCVEYASWDLSWIRLYISSGPYITGEVSGAPKVSLLHFYLPCFSRQDFRRAISATCAVLDLHGI